MELTGSDLDKIEQRNLRVPVVEFAELWVAAERQYDQDKSWASFGVVETCRWLAGATVRPKQGRWHMAATPVTERSVMPIAERIAEECLAADKLLFRRPVPSWVANRPGWLPAVVATLTWAWRGNGKPPIDVRAHANH
jgi:hypothetical protein